jgi:hypothetical protein
MHYLLTIVVSLSAVSVNGHKTVTPGLDLFGR